jgi:hypothetical protein
MSPHEVQKSWFARAMRLRILKASPPLGERETDGGGDTPQAFVKRSYSVRIYAHPKAGWTNMRFDKNIWDPTSREYNSATGLDTSYFNEPAKVFLSVWMERLTDFNAPVTRRLDRLCLLDLVDELLRALALWQSNDKTVHRVLLLLREIETSVACAATAVELPGQPEADRLHGIIPKFAEFIRTPNKERDKIWPAIAATLGRG